MSSGVTVNPSLDERIKEFRSDPQKMDVTNKFVNEVVEKAKDEAMKRMKEKEKDRVQGRNLDSGSTRKRGRWHSRARSFFSRIFSSFCFCSPETKV